MMVCKDKESNFIVSLLQKNKKNKSAALVTLVLLFSHLHTQEKGGGVKPAKTW